MNHKKSVGRREFLKSTAVGAAAMAAPTIVSSRVFGQTAPSNTLQIGCIGTGRMGHGDMSECLRQGLAEGINARVVAVCDLDRQRAEHAQKECTKFYDTELPDAPAPKVAIFDDYRDLLARDDIDGLTLSTPDHWHALIAIAAANAGKDMYVQKPLTHTINEGKQLVKAVQDNRVVLQTGSQQRSDERFRRACELVRNGRIGKLHTIKVAIPTDSGRGDPTPMEPPPHLNYEMWLGPAPLEPYTEDRVHSQSEIGTRPGWLQIEHYCRGMITGWGSHMFDIAQWGHGSDDTGPVAMNATGEFPDRGLFNVHTKFQASGAYADGVKLIAESGDPAGVTFEGDEGWLAVGRGWIKAEPNGILEEELGEDEARLYVSNNHMANFLECMRSRKQPICPVEVGHRSNNVCVVTHIAMKLGREVKWDPQEERFVNDDEANAMLDYPHREPWTVGGSATSRRASSHES